ncbi:MAG: gliding motility-associated C-terminal domain-containing protein [Flavobacteriales bacterium]
MIRKILGLFLMCCLLSFGTNSQTLYPAQVSGVEPGYAKVNIQNGKPIVTHPDDDEENPLYFRINTCGTNPGQTPFTVQIVSDSSYNGFDLPCPNTCEGYFRVIVTGGSGNFVYQWLGVALGPNNQQTWTQVCDQSSIQVLVTDVGQNITCFDNYNLNVPPRLRTINFSLTPPTCPEVCDGMASHFPIFGVPPYTFLWTPSGETTQNASNLCRGANTLTITDQNGCTFDTTIVIANPPDIVPNATTFSTSCFGFCDGAVVSSPTGGNGGPYTFLWSTSATTDSIGGVCAGNYSLTVFDVDGCSHDTIVTVTQPQPMLFSLVHQVHLLCFEVCTGELAVGVSQGTPPYSFQWFDANTNVLISTDSLVTGLCAGDYYAVVTDANGCFLNTPDYTITQPTEILVSTSFTPILCNSACNATVSATASGGTGALSYQWLQDCGGGFTSIGTNPNLSNLCACMYMVVVTDANGCSQPSDPFTITEPAPLVAIESITNNVCAGGCNGQISLTISGGIGGYSVEWFNTTTGNPIGQTTNPATNLCQGDYFAVITDANNCTLTTANFSIINPPPLTATTSFTNITCNGACNGTATVNVAGGTAASGSYTIVWINVATGNPLVPSQTGTTAINLCPGTYFAQITDDNGCTLQSINITITQPNPLTATLTFTNTSCGGLCDGSANVVISGGTASYSVNWFNVSTGVNIGSGAIITGLCSGNYNAVITDANGCTITTNTFSIIQPPPLSGNVTGTNLSCNGTCDGSATVNVLGGTPPYTFQWNDPSNQTTQTASGLCAGTYEVNIFDDNGCTFGPLSVTIGQPTAIVPILSVNNVSCFGNCDGTASVSVTGGGGGYSFSWSSSLNTTNNETNLCPGNYTVTISDVAGCDTTLNFTITEPNLLSINATGTNPSCLNFNDGILDVVINGGTPNYNVIWTTSPGGSVVGSGQTINAPAGTYQVTVTDANGCIQTAIVTTTDPPGMSLTTSFTNALCGGVCDGTASVTASGGVPGYTYQWFNLPNIPAAPIPGAIFDNVSNLCSGLYYVVVTDASGCFLLSDTLAVAEDITIAGNLTTNDVTCNGFSNGSASVTGSGGVGPYSFAWFDAFTGTQIGSGATINGLAAGTYYLIITDAVGCLAAPILFNINESPLLNLSLSTTNAICFGSCNGTGTASASGGQSPYTFTWFNSLGIQIGTGATINTLCAGNYTVVATDALGCSTTPVPFTITDAPPMNISVNTTNVNCFGNTTGSATVNISGGVAPHSVAWSSSANPGFTENNLGGGSYTVTVTDADGCSSGPIPFNINENSLLDLIIVNGAVSCAGFCNGAVSVSVSGGVAPYVYQWNDPFAQNTPVASNLCAGIYSVTVTDALGCVGGPLQATITEPLPSLSATASSTSVLCNGNCDGTATVVPAGGTAPYSVSWDDPFGQTAITAVGLCAGSYIATVTDANGCSFVTAAVTVTQPASINVNLSPLDAICNGVCNGQISAAVSGGTAPYSFLWNDPATQTTNPAVNLCAGTYNLTVTDANGCTTNTSATVGEATDITATVTSTAAICNLIPCDGTATISASGGTGTLNYLWSPGGQSTTTATQLCAGVYTITVTDANGCTEDFFATVSNPNGETVTTSETPTTCNGGCDGTATVSFTCSDPPCTVQWDDPANQTTNTAAGLCAGTYNAIVTNASGCITAVSVVVTEPILLNLSVSSTNVNCNGNCDGTATVTVNSGTPPFSFSWNDPAGQTAASAFNLCVGSYTVTVIDANGCVNTASVIITEPTAINAVTSVNNVNCNGSCNGVATVFPSGGMGGYTYVWTDPTSQTTQQATGLCAGTYSVTVFDALGCTFGPVNVSVTEPPAISASISATTVSCNGNCNATATVTVAGGTGGYSYQWNDPFSQNTATATNLCAGTYTVNVIDGNGCSVGPLSITISEPTQLTAVVNNGTTSCSGVCDGELMAVVSGGTAPYIYQWNDPLSQSTAIAINLCAGNYQLNIIDANGCFVNNLPGVVSPSPAINISLALTQVSCHGANDGAATATVTGGTAPLTLTWNPGGQNGVSVNNLSAGNYSLSVVDANGCLQNSPFVIVEQTALFVTGNFAGSTCNQCNGTATASPAGGVPPYTYQWSAAANNQTSQTATGLCAGLYSVTITDAAGCTENITIAVSDVNAEQLTITPTDGDCFNQCNGSAVAASPCIDGPCAFSWFDVSLGATFGGNVDNVNNLCPGDYFITVTNNTGCQTNLLFSIDAPPAILANELINNVTCNGVNDGSITITPSGGTGTLVINWAGGLGNGNTINNLAPGSYQVTITDDVNCQFDTTFVITEEPVLVLNVSSTDALCSAQCSGTASVTIAGGLPPYSISWNDPFGQTTPTAQNLCAGNYTVTVTDAAGCMQTAQVTVDEPQILAVTATSTDVLCNGDCSGTATANPIGGTTPYSFQWSDPSLQSTATAINLCSGAYQVIVTDANGCVSNPANVQISEPILLTVVVNSIDATCNGLCNGEATVVPSGGTAPYTFNWSASAGFQGTATATSLCAGQHFVTVTDANGCSVGPIPVNINNATVLTATTSSLDADCGQSNGVATVFISGGTPAYNYSWNDPSAQTTSSAINLPAGSYNVTVTDANGCQNIFNVTISNPTGPDVVVDNVSSPACHGDNTGAISISVSGATAPYSYLWSPNGSTQEDQINLSAGTYVVQVSDALGCITFETITISDAPAINASIGSVNTTCGDCVGSASVTASGGTGALSFVWTNNATAAAINNLCAGVYQVEITDNNGCSEIFSSTINDMGGPTGENITITPLACHGDCNATATVSAVGGTAPYTYTWLIDGTIGDTYSNLCAGEYMVEITDDNGCLRFIEVPVSEPAPIRDSVVMIPTTCGFCDGVLMVFVNGGFNPHSIQWDAAAGNATTTTVNNLCSGIYTAVITDANGCSESVSYAVNTSDAPFISLLPTGVACNGDCNGTITATIAGGTGPFTINWMDVNANPIGQIGPITNLLCPGIYFAEVIDGNGCASYAQAEIQEPQVLQVGSPNQVNISCGGGCDGTATVVPFGGSLPYSVAWSNGSTGFTASNLCVGSHIATITDVNGCSITQEVIITEPVPIVINLSGIDASCSTVNDGSASSNVTGGTGVYTYDWTGPNGFSSQQDQINNVFTGMYVLTVADANGCSASDSIFIDALIIVNADAGPDSTICSGAGLIQLTGTGGVTYEWFDLNGNLLSSSDVLNFNTTAPGTYTFVLVAADGLCTDSDTVQIIINPPPVVNAGPDRDIIKGETVQIGGNPTAPPGSTIVWTPNVNMNNNTIPNPSANPDTNTTYVVTVTDAFGCTNSDTMVVNILPDIVFPNGFSPNGDGYNDVWIIDFISEFPESVVEVYNRWGQLLFHSVGYRVPWDGTYEGKAVPVGTYYYVINLNHPLYPEPFTGPLTILR